MGNEGNDNYRAPIKLAVASKSAYEIRVDLLRLAFEMHANYDNGSKITAEQVIETATRFNEFISRRNE